MAEIPFSDYGIRWFEDIVRRITEWFTTELTSGLRTELISLLDTPLPEGQGTELIFAKPPDSDGLWHSIYESTVAGETMAFALLILFLSVQTRHFIRIFDVGSAFEDRRARKNSWIGAFLIVGWYWIGVATLYVVDALTIGLLPDMASVGESLVALLPHAAGTPGLTLIMATLGGTSMVALKALFFIREVLLYVYLYGMPIGIAIAYGNVPILSTIARRLCAQFIPLAVLPLPAAVLFRGYELLFTGDQQLAVDGSFLQYLVVISLPLIGLYLTWKTFRYAAPLAARTLSRAGRGAVLVGAAAGAGYAAGPGAAAATARWGAKAGAGSVVSSQFTSSRAPSEQQGRDEREQQTGGKPEYRRKENDPAYY
jgi:type IV secretion system protein TrbL